MTLLLGTDPEAFAIKDGKISSVAGILGCNKWKQKDLGNGIFLQEDNVLVEFATNPSDTFEHFNNIIQLGLDCCSEELGKVDMEIAPNVSSHIYSMAELKSFHRSAFEFGCEPDYNALTGSINPKPQAADAGLRTAGGHIHLGYESMLGTMKLEYSQAIAGVLCDYFLGLPSLLMDGDDRRRELYGKAGAIRKKSYGIEYRTLSNFWVFKEDTRKFVYEQATKVVDHMLGDFQRLVSIVDPQEIQRVINLADKRSAEKYIKLLKVA